MANVYIGGCLPDFALHFARYSTPQATHPAISLLPQTGKSPVIVAMTRLSLLRSVSLCHLSVTTRSSLPTKEILCLPTLGESLQHISATVLISMQNGHECQSQHRRPAHVCFHQSLPYSKRLFVVLTSLIGTASGRVQCSCSDLQAVSSGHV